jgi:hypothetical protein
VRNWDVGTEVEGCVADDDLGNLYVSEEAVGVWRYGAEPTAPVTPAARVLVDGTVAAGGHLVPDVEGLTIVYQPGGAGYLLASSQAASNSLNSYAVYERQGANAFVRSFRVVNGPAVDGCGRTDGIDALAADLGPAFPHGLFVCQDNANTAPGTTGNQNFKLVPLERVVALSDGGEPPPPPPADVIGFVGASTSLANARAHSVTVPAAVAAGDGLLLFVSSNSTATIGAPTGLAAPGWQLLDSVATGGTVTQAWRRVAVASDAGARVRVDVSVTSKVNLVVAAYRGTSGTDPVAAFARAAEPTRRTSHVTPTVQIADPQRWVVSYWTHKDSSTTALVPPPGVTVRASGTHTGSGRVTALVADSGAMVPVGPYGGLTATAAATSSAATMWTIVLAPAAPSTPATPMP